jgi:FeS assembly SUF system protein
MSLRKAWSTFWERLTAPPPAHSPVIEQSAPSAAAPALSATPAPTIQPRPEPAPTPSVLTRRDQAPHPADSVPPKSAILGAGGTAWPSAAAPEFTAGGEGLRERIVAVLKTIFDPEIPVDIYELGLIYEIRIESFPHVVIEMTLTSPNCPEAQTLPMAVRYKIEAIPGVGSAEVRVVWNPPWEPTFMSESAKLALNML